MSLKMGLTGLALLAAGACSTTKLVIPKGVCTTEEVECDPDATYLPNDPCYEVVQKYHRDYPKPVAYSGGSSPSDRSDHDHFAGRGMGYERPSSGREKKCFRK